MHPLIQLFLEREVEQVPCSELDFTAFKDHDEIDFSHFKHDKVYYKKVLVPLVKHIRRTLLRHDRVPWGGLGKELSKGCNGIVYLSKDGNMVYKRPLLPDETEQNMAEDTKVDFLNEIVTLWVLRQTRAPWTAHFPRLKGLYVKDAILYSGMEFVKGQELWELMSERFGKPGFIQMMNEIYVQVILACQLAYEHVRFCHNDLSNANILVRTLDRPRTHRFELSGKVYEATSCYLPVMVDFGQSQLFVPSSIPMPPELSFLKKDNGFFHGQWNEYYVYNPLRPTRLQNVLMLIWESLNAFRYVDEKTFNVLLDTWTKPIAKGKTPSVLCRDECVKLDLRNAPLHKDIDLLDYLHQVDAAKKLLRIV